MSRFFISYRRDDTEGEAGRVADRLMAHFGAGAVFYDRESLQAGDLWRTRIDTALAGCELMLLLIGPRWEHITGANGRPRLHDPDDVAAYEVASALKRGIRLIPLLVRRTQLPARADLPAALARLGDAQARMLHADAFGPLVQALIDEIDGEPDTGTGSGSVQRARAQRQGIPAWGWAGAAAAAVALVFGGWLMRPAPLPLPLLPVAVAKDPEQISGQLHLRVQLAPDGLADPAVGEAPGEQNVLMALIDPIESKIELPAPVGASAQQLDFVLLRTLLPQSGQRYEADLTRRVQSAHRGAPRRTTLCLRRTAAAPAQDLRVDVECVEGQRCKAADGNPGHFVVSCSAAAPAPVSNPVSTPGPGPAASTPRKVSALDRLDWLGLPSAMAQTPAAAMPGGAADAQANAQVWSIPSIATLRRREAAGTAAAYVEVMLNSPPLPELRAASRVSLQIIVNGQPAWIDGLSPEAATLPFDAELGLRLQFGLENLDFSGVHQASTEKLALRLRFLDGKAVVREWQADLKYVALRPKPDAKVVGDPALGIAWTARYFPGSSSDRWQVFLQAAQTPAGIEDAKRRFDQAAFRLQDSGVGLGAARPLVAVIRPPWQQNPNWGLNVGVQLPSGQIRFSFDDAQSAALCRQLASLAGEPRHGLRSDTFRRRIDGAVGSNACKQFARR